MSCPLDPVVLLNVLEPILDKRTGGVRDVQLVDRFVNVMRDARKLVQRCIYLNIFQSTQSEAIRQEIIKLGGWDILYEWLKESERLRHWTFATQILELFINLPVTIDQLRSNGAPKLIRRLSKRQDIDSSVRNLATDILSIWKDIVIDDHTSGREKSKQEFEQELLLEAKSSSNDGMTSTIDPNIDLEAADEPYTIASSATTSVSLPSFYSGEGKSAQNKNTHLKVAKPPPVVSTNHVQQPLTKLGKLDKGEKLNRKDIEQILKQQQKADGEKEKKAAAEEKQKKMTPERKAAVVGSKRLHEAALADAFGAALSGADEASAPAASKRPKTVKTYRTTFRSTGLDQEPELAAVSVKKRKTPADAASVLKRKDSTEIPELLGSNKHHKSHPHRTTTPAQKSSTQSEKSKAAPAAVTNLPRSSSSDSNLLGDQLTEQQPILSPTSTGPNGGIAATKSPKATAKGAQMFESDSFMAALTGSSQPRTAAIIRRKKITPAAETAAGNGKAGVQSTSEPQVTIPKPQFYKEIIRTPATTAIADTSAAPAQSAPAAVDTSSTAPLDESEAGKSVKKSVRWAKEHELVQVRHFELEDGERAHKALGLKSCDLASLDKKMEREAMEAARKGQRVASGAPEPETYFNWKLVKCDTTIDLVPKGVKSQEKIVQQERMKNVLADIYFSQETIPDTPKEPDLFVGAPAQEAAPRIIPLDDVVPEPESQMDTPGGMGSMPGAPPAVGPGQTSLPPELAQLLQNLNKTGMIPQAPQVPVGGPPMGMTGFGNTGPGYGQPPPPGVGFGMGQPGMGQQPLPPQPPYGPGGVPMNQQQGMRIQFPIPPGVGGMPPQMQNTGQQQMFPNPMQQGQQQPPQFGPQSGGLMGCPPPAGGGGWNSQMVNSPPLNSIRPPTHNQNGGGFRPRGAGPSGGFGQRHMGSRFDQRAGRDHGASRFERPCPFFMRGRCTYGDSCRYKHTEPPPSGASPNPDHTSSPPGSNEQDRGRSTRSGRGRFRSPPPGNRFHQRRGGGRSGSRERDRGDKDFRNKFRPSQHMSPTYSPIERYRSSPPAQIMDDSPVRGTQADGRGGGGPSVDVNGGSNMMDLRQRKPGDQNDSTSVVIPDTPASP